MLWLPGIVAALLLAQTPPAPPASEPADVPEVKEEVTVSATRTDRRLQDEPLRVEVIDREEIEEKALMTPGSVAMLLGETTGLRVQTVAPSLGAANVRIQGLRGRYAQLLADGLPLYGAGGDSLNLLQVPPLDLGQVEVIKGAASALYGPAALGGIINLVSRRAPAAETEALVNVTSQAGLDGTFWKASAPVEGRSWSLLTGFHGQRRQDLDGDGWSDLPAFARAVVRPRVPNRVGYRRGAVRDRRGDRRAARRRHRARRARARRRAVRTGSGHVSRRRRCRRAVGRRHGACSPRVPRSRATASGARSATSWSAAPGTPRSVKPR